MDDLTYDVMMAEVFDIHEDQVIREHQDAKKIRRFKGDTEVNLANIKKAIRRSSKRK
jgi:hypothetical protein